MDMSAGWADDSLERREAAAIIWRLSDSPEPQIEATFSDLDEATHPFEDPIGYIVDPSPHPRHNPHRYDQVWSNAAGEFDPLDPVLRGDFIRLLYRVYWAPPGSGPADFDDWGDIPTGTDLRSAVRWADQAGISCASSFLAGNPLTRRIAAKWIRRAQRGIECTGTEAA